VLWLTPIILLWQILRWGGVGFQANLGKKFVRPHLNIEETWVWWHEPVIPATVASLNRRIKVHVGQSGTGDLAQVVDRLPNKCKAINKQTRKTKNCAKKILSISPGTHSCHR
jgi:hypothetical protein